MEFGIWKFDEKDGLVGYPQNFPPVNLNMENLWDILETSEKKVWKWPLHYARSPWFTPRIADDFNRAFFHAQNIFKNTRPTHIPADFEISAQTLHFQTELLNDYFNGEL